MKRPPLWAKQNAAINFALDRKDAGFGLFMEMGTGKSRVMINVIQHWIADGARLGYIVAPISGMHVWVHEWKLWGGYPVLFVDLQAEGVAGLHKAKDAAAKGWPVICLINYESAWQLGHVRKKVMEKGQEVTKLVPTADALHMTDWDFGVLDESQKIKTPGAKVSMYFRNRMIKVTEKRAVLTGSAYTKRPLDVWAQVTFAVGEGHFGKFADFKSRYSIPHPYIQGAIKEYVNLDHLAQRLSEVCVLLKKEDVLDLPPALHVKKPIILGAKAKKVYSDLVKECYAEFEAFEAAEQEKKAENPSYRVKTITADHIFSKTVRMRQLTSGLAITDGDWDEGQECFLAAEQLIIDDAKIKALLEILEDRDKPTLIVVQFDFEEKLVADAIEKEFGKRPKILNGSVVGAANRHAMVAEMANDTFAIIKEEVGCRAMDMRFADLTVFFSHRPNTEAYDQMLARNHRGGQTKPITYVHLLAEGTIDYRILGILESDLERAKLIEGHWRDFLAS